MLISGIQKTTLVDFPWKVATIIFTAWCNLRCRYCHNPDFVLPERIALIRDFIPEEIFFRYLKTRVGLIDGVVICGGEPTLQKDLKAFCQRVKSLGFSLKLDTNGRDPELLKELIDEGLVDYVAMDIKGHFARWQDLVGAQDAGKYLESIRILKESKIDYEFRTTLIKSYHQVEDFALVAEQIAWAKKYFLQNYRAGQTLDESFEWSGFSLCELKQFQEIALHFVQSCTLRA